MNWIDWGIVCRDLAVIVAWELMAAILHFGHVPPMPWRRDR